MRLRSGGDCGALAAFVSALLAMFLALGVGGQAASAQDGTPSLAVLGRACSEGEARSCGQAAGLLLESDPDRARVLLESGCAGEDVGSCRALGMNLVSGPEEARDYARAVPLLAAACDEGFGLACGSVSNLILLGEGTPADKPRAATLAERGCALDDPRSCLSVGLYFATDEIFPLDFNRAGPALVMACRNSEPEACRLLENVATNAVLARDPRFPRAAGLELFDVACSGDMPRSCGALGGFLTEGLFGPADLPRAAAAFERGCALDNVTSCAKLAEAYRTGRGVARDHIRARELVNRALSLDPDHADARRTLNRLQ